MTFFILFLSTSMTNNDQPGPIDAYRSNYASIHAEVFYSYVNGNFKGNGSSVWDRKNSQFIPNDETLIHGIWACDGKTEYFNYGSNEETIVRARRSLKKSESSKVGHSVFYVPKTEALWNGDVLIWHRAGSLDLDRDSDPDWTRLEAKLVGDESFLMIDGKGPLNWGFSRMYPNIIQSVYNDANHTSSHVVIDGRYVEIDSFRKDMGDMGWMNFEIAHDPSIGYIPRFARYIGYNKKMDMSIVSEVYIIEASACKSGGFIPTEYFNLSFDVENFSLIMKKYYPIMDLKPKFSRIGGGHFIVDKMIDLESTVRLRDTKGVTAVSGIGGTERLNSSVISKMSIDDFKLKMGKKLTEPAQKVLPKIDQDEIDQQFSRSRNFLNNPVIICIIVVVVICYFYFRRACKHGYNSMAGSIIIIIILSGGCGRTMSPMIKLNASYKNTTVYTDPGSRNIAMQMLIQNSGNLPLKLHGVDGGCTCRKVDNSIFPLNLKPGESMNVDISITSTSASSPQSSQFLINTDKGNFTVQVPYFVVLSHQFDPEIITNNSLNEENTWTFELTHRHIYLIGNNPDDFSIEFPSSFQIEKIGTSGGLVGSLNNYKYSDTKYKLILTDRSLGMHKNVIVLRNSEGRVIHETPIVWNRVPYLSTAPERVAIATRPVRVFLRCPDDQVELLKVLSVPKGVKAVITSTRELTVMLDEHPPEILRGEIEVQTSAQGKPPLKFMVVRYAPSIPKPQSKPSS